MYDYKVTDLRWLEKNLTLSREQCQVQYEIWGLKPFLATLYLEGDGAVPSKYSSGK